MLPRTFSSAWDSKGFALKEAIFVKKRVALVLFLCVALLGAGVFATIRYGKSASGEESAEERMRKLFAEPRPVLLEEVRSVGGGGDRSYPGVARASREAFLSFRVGGPLVKVDAQPGDLVKKGHVLMRIDPRDFESDIRALESRLAGAQALLEKAKLDHLRAKSLLAENVISKAAFDATLADHDTAKASVKNLQTQIQTARHRLADTKLEAPFDGIVSGRRVDNHEMVAAGQVVMAILDLSNLEIRVSVPESEIAHRSLKAGQEAYVVFSPLPGKRFPAHLKEWDATPDPATRTYAVTFALPAPEEGQVLPGMTGDVCWGRAIPNAADGISLPVEALVPDGDGGSAVWIYDAETSTPVKRRVRTGSFVEQGRVSILEGLVPGEKVVAAGAVFVSEEMKIKPMRHR